MIKVTNELEKIFLANPLYSKDGQGKQAEVIAKFFMPFTTAYWLITEAEKEDNDWLLFGYCHITDWEFGYVRLSEIQSLNLRGITAEMDKFLPKGITIDECLQDINFAGV